MIFFHTRSIHESRFFGSVVFELNVFGFGVGEGRECCMLLDPHSKMCICDCIIDAVLLLPPPPQQSVCLLFLCLMSLQVTSFMLFVLKA